MPIKAEDGGKLMKKIQKMRRMIQRKFREGIAILKDNSGLSVIEMLLILVVIIALILIFKNQLIGKEKRKGQYEVRLRHF